MATAPPLTCLSGFSLCFPEGSFFLSGSRNSSTRFPRTRGIPRPGLGVPCTEQAPCPPPRLGRLRGPGPRPLHLQIATRGQQTSDRADVCSLTIREGVGRAFGAPLPLRLLPSRPRQMQGAPCLVLAQRGTLCWAQDQVTSQSAASLGDALPPSTPDPQETNRGEIWGTKKRGAGRSPLSALLGPC